MASGEAIGLELIPGYLIRVVIVYTRDYGGGQPRGRLYFLGMRTDDESQMEIPPGHPPYHKVIPGHLCIFYVDLIICSMKHVSGYM